MRILQLSILLLLVGAAYVHAEQGGALYTHAFGDSTDPAIIFLHGGPGYNCANFELTTAQRLADSGYYVVVFDQRGCGRSTAMTGNAYTMNEAVADLKSVYSRYGLGKAVLIGHSWGGTLGGFFARQHPGMVERLVLVGSPLSYQATLRTILKECKAYYTQLKDSVNLGYITALEMMDTASLPYSSFLFLHALSCGLYAPTSPSREAKEIYKNLSAMPEAKLLAQSEQAPVQGLHTHERYTTLDMAETFRSCAKSGVKVSGIYGMQDGLFDREHLERIEMLVGTENFRTIQGASHNVFIDQQTPFLEALIAQLR